MQRLFHSKLPLHSQTDKSTGDGYFNNISILKSTYMGKQETPRCNCLEEAQAYYIFVSLVIFMNTIQKISLNMQQGIGGMN